MMNLSLLINKGRKFLKISWADKLMFIVAFFLTGLIRFSILFISFNKLAALLGKYNDESTYNLCDEQILLRDKIRYVVYFVSRYTPWESKCLVRALTAQIMLRTRKVSSTVYLGVAKNKNKELLAHAWLRCGENIITGDEERQGCIMVAKFANHSGEVKE